MAAAAATRAPAVLVRIRVTPTLTVIGIPFANAYTEEILQRPPRADEMVSSS